MSAAPPAATDRAPPSEAAPTSPSDPRDPLAESAPPPPGARVVAAFLAGRTAFGLAHLAGAARDWPIPWYLPLERAFVFGPRPPAFAMEWFGRSLASFAAGAAVTAAVWLLAKRDPLARALRSKAFVLSLAQATALALLVDFTYFTWVFLTQPVRPLPLPPGCIP